MAITLPFVPKNAILWYYFLVPFIIYPIFIVVGILPFIIIGGLIYLIKYTNKKNNELQNKSDQYLKDIHTISENSKNK